MTAKNEEWTAGEVCIVLTMCAVLYALGFITLGYVKSLLGLGFVLTSSLLFVPALLEARTKIRRCLKKRRGEKLRKSQKTFVVGGEPQEHHKKKKRPPDVYDYLAPVIDDETSKGKLMEELGLWYEKPTKRFSFEEKESRISTGESSVPGRTYRQLNELFDTLNYYKRIRIAHQANIGGGHHGNSVRRMAKSEAKRRGVSISIRDKGKDMIIETKRSPKRVV